MQFISSVLEVAGLLVEEGRPPETTLARALTIVRRRPLPRGPVGRSAVKAERSVLHALVTSALDNPSRRNPAAWASRVYRKRLVADS